MSDTRVAIVTGAAGGIGQAIARQLADDGLDVTVSDLDATRACLEQLTQDINARGRRARAVTGDVTDASSVEHLLATTVDLFGRLDVMVANAGVVSAVPLLDLSPQEWDRIMTVNARGTLLCYQAAARQMIRQGDGGRIIGAASVAAHHSSALVGHYSASKFAVRSLTEAAALEWAEHQITVNAYSPGLVHTRMWDDLDSEIVGLHGGSPGDAISGAIAEIPLGRVQHPDDVAGPGLLSRLAGSRLHDRPISDHRRRHDAGLMVPAPGRVTHHRPERVLERVPAGVLRDPGRPGWSAERRRRLNTPAEGGRGGGAGVRRRSVPAVA